MCWNPGVSGVVAAITPRLGLEIYKFEADLSSERFAPRVRGDIESGKASGVTRTPTFFINDVRFDGQRELEPLYASIESAAGAD